MKILVKHLDDQKLLNVKFSFTFLMPDVLKKEKLILYESILKKNNVDFKTKTSNYDLSYILIRITTISSFLKTNLSKNIEI